MFFSKQKQSSNESLKDWQTLCSLRRQYTVEVKQPLVLISQIQRSGGTLLSQLFDSHPQCHAHPYELYIGHPEKHLWPQLDLSAKPEDWFERLSEKVSHKLFHRGYQKRVKWTAPHQETLPFLQPPVLQESLFKAYLEKKPAKTERDILNAYMTSYFNAWLDNQNLYSKNKRVITAFVPRMNMESISREGFFRTYPDGKWISLIRDPKTWFASAKTQDPKSYSNLEKSISLWSQSTKASLDLKRQFPNQVLVLFYEDLVSATEATMRMVSEFIGIEYSEVLLEPTFNSFPIKADSSFEVQEHGIISETLSRDQQFLSEEERKEIDRLSLELYNQAKLEVGATCHG